MIAVRTSRGRAETNLLSSAALPDALSARGTGLDSLLAARGHTFVLCWVRVGLGEGREWKGRERDG